MGRSNQGESLADGAVELASAAPRVPSRMPLLSAAVWWRKVLRETGLVSMESFMSHVLPQTRYNYLD
jgi:hypothetical protein